MYEFTEKQLYIIIDALYCGYQSERDDRFILLLRDIRDKYNINVNDYPTREEYEALRQKELKEERLRLFKELLDDL